MIDMRFEPVMIPAVVYYMYLVSLYGPALATPSSAEHPKMSTKLAFDAYEHCAKEYPALPDKATEDVAVEASTFRLSDHVTQLTCRH